MDKNENFKNVLNNLKNLSGGMDNEGPEPETVLKTTETPETKSDPNEILENDKTRKTAIQILLPFYGIFSFLNPFFFILKYVDTENKNNGLDSDFETMIGIHSFIFAMTFILFFLYIFPIPGIGALYTEESELNKNGNFINYWRFLFFIRNLT